MRPFVNALFAAARPVVVLVGLWGDKVNVEERVLLLLVRSLLIWCLRGVEVGKSRGCQWLPTNSVASNPPTRLLRVCGVCAL